MIPDQTNSEPRMNICDHAVVAMHYTLKNAEGAVLDSSEGQDPLTYLHGTGGIITGLEAALLDKVIQTSARYKITLHQLQPKQL